MSIFMIKTEDQLIEQYPCIADENAILAYLVALDGTPIGEFSSLMKYRNKDIFEKIMENIRKNKLSGGSILLNRQRKPYVIAMVVQESYKGKAQLDYINTCLSKLAILIDKVNSNNLYLSKDAFLKDDKTEIENSHEKLNLFFI